jgi:hypothetical protein
MNQSGRPITFAELGGAGAMGRITVRDLIETTPLGTEVLIADYNLPAAKKLAREMEPSGGGGSHRRTRLCWRVPC